MRCIPSSEGNGYPFFLVKTPSTFSIRRERSNHSATALPSYHLPPSKYVALTPRSGALLPPVCWGAPLSVEKISRVLSHNPFFFREPVMFFTASSMATKLKVINSRQKVGHLWASVLCRKWGIFELVCYAERAICSNGTIKMRMSIRCFGYKWISLLNLHRVLPTVTIKKSSSIIRFSMDLYRLFKRKAKTFRQKTFSLEFDCSALWAAYGPTYATQALDTWLLYYAEFTNCYGPQF